MKKPIISTLLMTSSVISAVVNAATGVQVGATGKTYASSGIQCALHPVKGMAPLAKAGLYNPVTTSTAAVSDNSVAIAKVTFYNPDADVWLVNGLNSVKVALNKRTADSYSFDASLTYNSQPNVCIPDTRSNFVDYQPDLETAASGKSSAIVTPGCAWNPLTGRAQPFVNLFDNGTYLLNVSVNNVALTQLNGTTRKSTPVFLAPGLNVITAVNGTLSTDEYVRDGGTGSCQL